jgi:hypothetical protein
VLRVVGLRVENWGCLGLKVDYRALSPEGRSTPTRQSSRNTELCPWLSCLEDLALRLQVYQLNLAGHIAMLQQRRC